MKLNGHAIQTDIAITLMNHEYRFGFDTNCSCEYPSVWTWDDYVDHVSWLMAEVLYLNIQSGLNAYAETTDPQVQPTPGGESTGG